MPIQTGDNKFGVAQWIVDPVAGLGTHTTIAAAITSASSGDTIFIRPGTYVENLTLKAGVNLASFTADGMNGQVVIQGKLSNATASNISISGIQIETNADFGIENTSTGGISLTNCRLLATDNTFFSNSGAAEIVARYCIGDVQALGITLAALTAGSLRCTYCIFLNSGSSTTVSTFSNASLLLNFTAISNAVQISGTTGMIQGSNNLFVPNINLTAIDYTSTSATPSNLTQCDFNTGTQPCITIGAGAIINVYNTSFNSTAANVITGAGQLGGANNTFTLNNGISAATLTPFNDGPVYVNSIQPAFLAFNSVTDADVTGAGTPYTVLFDTEVFDVGSNYNPATGVFTAPYTGKYLFCFSVFATDISAGMTQANARLVTSNRSYIYLINPLAAAESSVNGVSFPLSVIADMDAGDTAAVTITISGGGGDTADVFGSADCHTYFSGKLIC